jgi:KaiC/GvpD/RAD55 family RecA-like ATPase
MENDFLYTKKKESAERKLDSSDSFSELKNFVGSEKPSNFENDSSISETRVEPQVVEIKKPVQPEIISNNPDVVQPSVEIKNIKQSENSTSSDYVSNNNSVSQNNEDNNYDVQQKETVDYSGKKISTGIKGFDELVGGGYEKDSTILLVGTAGTGKTLFALQFLYNGIMESNEPGLFISFEETRKSLYTNALRFGWDFQKLEREGKFRLIEFKPHQMTKIIEEGGGSVKDILSEINAKRIVVDSITAYGLLFHDEYMRREKVLEFLNSLRKWDVTSIVVAEESPREIEDKTGSIGFITDAIISLYYKQDEEKGIRIHSLEVVKMRGSEHTNKLCAFNFEKNGIRVYPDIEVF